MFLDIKDYVNSADKLLAHNDKKNNRTESFLEHAEAVRDVFYHINNKKRILDIVKGMLKEFKVKHEDREIKLSDSTIDFLLECFVNAIVLHDIGKINPFFQTDVLKNRRVKRLYKEDNNMSSDHATLSSLLYLDILVPMLKERVVNEDEYIDDIEKYISYYILLSMAHVVYSHHINLDQLNPFIVEINNEIIHHNNFDYLVFYNKGKIDKLKFDVDLINCLDFDGHILFALTRLLYSTLVSADHFASYAFVEKEDLALDLGLIDKAEGKRLHKLYNNGKICKAITNYKYGKNNFVDSPINRLRSDIFLETQENFNKNLDKNVFNLEAPTGSGKTNTSINLAMNAVSKAGAQKIFYVFPFNTLVDQTKDTVAGYFDGEVELSTINSISSINKRFDSSGFADLDRASIDHELMCYPVVFTSHVSFFSWMFSEAKRSIIPMFQLLNSVIILDEIQSYRSEIWVEMANFFKRYAKLLNIKLIIMSATLPNLEELLDFEDRSFIELLPDPQKYYQNPLFKNRVNIRTDIHTMGNLDVGDILDQVKKHYFQEIRTRGNTTALVEFITKTSCNKFYKSLKDDPMMKDVIIREITGDDSALSRRKTINLIKSNEALGPNKKSLILVCTQVIEAGVDIDMDIGFKDSSIFESEEQVLGRINRSCKKENCKCYFFEHDAAFKVYEDDVRINFGLSSRPDLFSVLENKNMKEYYMRVLPYMKKLSEARNSDGIHIFHQELRELDYRNIASHMQLIVSDTIRVFLPYTIDVGGKEVNGKDIWRDLMITSTDFSLNPSERKIITKALGFNVSLFTFTVYLAPLEGKENYFDIYYIEDGSRFIEDGKFQRKKFMEEYK